jgi:hypothetical protein
LEEEGLHVNVDELRGGTVEEHPVRCAIAEP